jgi:hypothetical protein
MAIDLIHHVCIAAKEDERAFLERLQQVLAG